MKRFIKLQPRLNAIAGFIRAGAAVADIGTDHGLLPVYLAQNGLASRIFASDMSAGSLEAARRNAAKYNVTDSISFIVAPGLNGISETDVDTIVIAGVGGETIIDILQNAAWTKQSGKQFILQPQTKQKELTEWLCYNGYKICETCPAFDRGRHYTIILVEWENENAPDH